ncbi:MAG TPA: isoprenylcysteine carboxylmethyltransferase family protein [Steroidobacteraceae bacterium]|nr:isoprenylcysteine carboxylmethyltransferase family protein [Steroidobacteraceae bacterium]
MHRDPHFYRQLIGWLWLAWGLYWMLRAVGAKRTARRESWLSRFAHVVPLSIGAILLGWRTLPWPWLAQRLWPRSFVVYCIGMVLLVAGLLFTVWAREHLGRNWSGTVTVKQDHELIRTGPYGYVRHPIYTGGLTAVLGTALASGTVRAWLGFAIIAIALIRKLRIEERFMAETFPGSYAAYRAQVPALMPFTKPRRSAPR